MKRINDTVVLLAFLLLFIGLVFVLPSGIAPNIVGPNHKNVTVTTYVNITHSRPEVLNVSIYELVNMSNRNVTIAAGGIKTVYCNATLRSWNGFADITNVNATLFHVPSSNHTLIDNNNSHYTNSTCVLNGTTASPFIGWFVCSFDVYYYANNGTWMCNVTVKDSWNYTNYGANTTTFYPVYALNVTDGIDYGGVAVYDYSNNTVANLTNFGNMAINVTVEGYGARRGDGLAMNCSLNGNITVDNERFSLSNDTLFAAKTVLASSPVLIPTLTMPKQTIPGTQIINSTYWQLYIPPNPAGNCTGAIVFTAIAP
jgi:hypothetical protein